MHSQVRRTSRVGTTMVRNPTPSVAIKPKASEILIGVRITMLYAVVARGGASLGSSAPAGRAVLAEALFLYAPDSERAKPWAKCPMHPGRSEEPEHKKGPVSRAFVSWS